MKNYTYADVKRGLLKETYLYFKFIAYILAVPFAFIVYKLKISPNQLTTFGILLTIPAMYFNLRGDYIIAILTFHFFFLIDAADGILARGTDTKSKFGAYLDITAHYIFHTLFFITFALKVFEDGYIKLALFMSLFLIVNSLYRIHCDFILKASIKNSDEEGLLEQSSEDKEHKSLLKKMMSIIVEAFNFPNVLVYLTLLIWNFDLLKIYFECATFVSILYFIYTIYQSFIKMHMYDHSEMIIFNHSFEYIHSYR